ncbi:hypothetical protein GWK47_014210 [Chionoecetes opilio]|uniref:Uncharacterized protein n=1 Tax=Chionoecetes opilio TaxID=41210 RepID=A0A8J4XV90_CHIOP|nr:hypothetical protein GWK47_014210 [Chionoecetes opilio]
MIPCPSECLCTPLVPRILSALQMRTQVRSVSSDVGNLSQQEKIKRLRKNPKPIHLSAPPRGPGRPSSLGDLFRPRGQDYPKGTSVSFFPTVTSPKNDSSPARVLLLKGKTSYRSSETPMTMLEFQ